jgi:alkanesulfonate monooxygenase SsuD/methylene tetrahydromethanopterin reductase-like flavin-dependent oxidoreductase (luciferase family)
MRIGIALPTAIAGASAPLLIPWARRAEDGPFASLGVHDRLAYDSLEPLTALAAAAGVTTRLRLACLVAIAPLRRTAILAKQAATVDAISGGRLTLGLGIGPRPDDYELAGMPFGARGRILDEQLMALRPLWRQGTLNPSSARPHGPDLVLGGLSDRALVRLVRYADGYVHGGGPPRAFRSATDRVRAAWSDVGRPGHPRLWGTGYFALGPDAGDIGRAHLHHYYGFTGAFADRIVAGLLTTPEEIGEFARGYAEAGCDDLMLFPTVADLAQVDLLAGVVAQL